jgi:hypothetical protein
VAAPPRSVSVRPGILERKGRGPKIHAADLRRGPGKPKQEKGRENTPIEWRYEFAAWRLCGKLWKQIAADYDMKQSTVIKAGSEVLRRAGWLS